MGVFSSKARKAEDNKVVVKELHANIQKLTVQIVFLEGLKTGNNYEKCTQMNPREREAMINWAPTDLSLTKHCTLLKISRSSLY